MNPLTEDEWNNLRNNFINERLSQNLTVRFKEMFNGNEEVIPMINFDGLTPEQKEEAFNIYILNDIGEDPFADEEVGGRKPRRSKKYKKTRRRRGSKKRRNGRKSRRHR
jgi:hypothetical protein